MKFIDFSFFYALGVALVLSSVSIVFANAPATPKIAFTSDRDGNLEIYTMNPDGSEQVNLTRHPASDFQPAWAPTGRQILFTSNRDGRADLYLMDGDGANVQKVFKKGAVRFSPAWSRDGKQIAYCSETHLYIATLNEKMEKQVTEVAEFGGYPSWAPDGTSIVFEGQVQARFANTQICLFNLQTRRKEVLLPDEGPSLGAPEWSPDGDKIAFSGWLRGEPSAIYIMNGDGTNPEAVAVPPPGFLADYPAWAPHGDALVYEQYDVNNSRQLFTVNLKEGKPKNLTHKGINFFAHWFDPAFALPVAPQPQLLTTQWGEVKIRD